MTKEEMVTRKMAEALQEACKDFADACREFRDVFLKTFLWRNLPG
jgi:DNA-directed RNA polymerase subunit L